MRPSAWRTAWKVLRLIWPAPGIALHRITARAGSVRTETDPPRETSRRAKNAAMRGRPGGQAGHAGVAHARVGGAEGEMAVGVDEDLAVGGAEEGEGEPERDRARVVVAEAERRPRGLDGDRHRRARVPGRRGGEPEARAVEVERVAPDHEVAAVLDDRHVVDVAIVGPRAAIRTAPARSAWPATSSRSRPGRVPHPAGSPAAGLARGPTRWRGIRAGRSAW